MLLRLVVNERSQIDINYCKDFFNVQSLRGRLGYNPVMIEDVCSPQFAEDHDDYLLKRPSNRTQISWQSFQLSLKMDNNTQSVRSKGIYQGLPVTKQKHQGLGAIVVGASGMSGQSQIDVLLQSPQRWKTVFALSRRPPLSTIETTALQHIPVDLLEESGDIASRLTAAKVRA